MRIAVLADIHGNLAALEAILEALERTPVDGLLAAGDYVGCPDANRTLELLRSQNARMIRGNSDLNLIKLASGQAPETWQNSKQFGLLRWALDDIQPENLRFLERLPDQLTVDLRPGGSVRMVHGSLWDPYEQIFPERDPGLVSRILAMIEEQVFVCGHTHQPWVFRQGGKAALNPGAVCGPLSGDPRPQYALLTWRNGDLQVEHKSVSYDLQPVRRSFIDSGLLEAGSGLARGFLLSIETGLNVGEHFLDYAYSLAAKAGLKDCAVLPDDIWDQACMQFDWESYTSRMPG